MARRLRLFLTEVPYHVVQRGNNKNSIFFSKEDYFFFLKVLQEAKIKHPCFIYAYCLMPNHLHLLIQPKEKDNISLLMKLLGAKYVRYVNKHHQRTGTLWEGRFRCSLIDEESYFLTCLHYIEMNPVRAGIVNLPELYHWSSYRVRAFSEENPIVDLDPWYNTISTNVQERQLRYRQSFQNLITEKALNFIREMTNKGGIIGSNIFKKQIEKVLGKEIVIRHQGRPRNGEK